VSTARHPVYGDEVAIGRARSDRRTKELLKRLRPGEVAVIDHVDLDRIAAEGLIEAGAAAVVNASKSISGRYPNMGPLLIAAAGIPLLDDCGPDVMTGIREGDEVRVQGDEVWVGDHRIATGARHDMHSLEERIETARQTMGDELEQFAANTLEYLRRERHLLTDSPNLPDVRTEFKARHVLIVVRGHGYKDDLRQLRAYIREMRPVLIGVDGGADAILDVGSKPDLIIGDFDSVSDAALRSGAELVVHAYSGGRAPGADRLREMGLDFVTFEAVGTSEDIAMLLAYERGAELLVAVGTHASAVEFLDKGRPGMASTFLVRLKVGPILVDAKGVNRLYQSTVRKRDLMFLVVSAVLTMLMIALISVPLHTFFRGFYLLFR
jgi:uncharacterized membrane-anchored protein